ncbi:hypothetical protein Pla175_19360 [Pirellulimonas nuda]|uniref:Amidohydrolase n=1 Tax=Pirellulimonas nuda TaxID=2528009 RepID=A0A518DAR9_9BACT|nr:DUF6282 family protein [Pirellulimonas nuda]QDU88558.1 hypothetical protein Pla175_19360 [Pirellulimonas nuda]
MNLVGAFDIHLHCAPDVTARAQDFMDLAQHASRLGMAGIGLKDHVTSTVGRCFALNRLFPNGPRFFSSLVLNPPVGGMNPAAVEAALQAGADVIYFPTYSALHHVQTLGPEVSPVPHPRRGVQQLEALSDGLLKADVIEIIDLIVEHDAVLATGHLSPAESLAILKRGAECGARRMLVTHASEIVPCMSVDQQREAVGLGARIEHCLLAATECCPGTIELSEIARQIRLVGVDHVILSSDFGQPANGAPLDAFGNYLDRLAQEGFSSQEIRTLICDNPRTLLCEGRAPCSQF